jgi:hypothetical protein
MKLSRVYAVLVVFAVVFAATLLWAAEPGKNDVPKKSTKEVLAMLGNPNVVIIDVRAEWDWAKSKTKIKGAVREEPALVDKWAVKYAREKIIILYCA